MIKRYKPSRSLPNVYFNPDVNITSSSTFYQADVPIVGANSSTITIKVTAYTNTNNAGHIYVNTIEKFLNDTFTVTLDGSGNGHFTVRVQGNDADTSTLVFCTFTIMSFTDGKAGTPLTKNESKVF